MWNESSHQTKVCDLSGDPLRLVHGELQGLLAAQEMSKTWFFSGISQMFCFNSSFLGSLFLCYPFSKAGSLRSWMRIYHHSPDLSPNQI